MSNTRLVIDQALAPLLALFERTDDQAIKCEVLRTLVALIKTLWSTVELADEDAARSRMTDASVVVPLTRCGRQYPVLIGEVVFALTLLLDTKTAADTIVNEIQATTSFLNDLLAALRDDQIPAQVKSNICLFLLKLRGLMKAPAVESERVVEALQDVAGDPVTANVAQQARKAWQT